MKPEYDVRRTVKLTHPVTGQEISDALAKFLAESNFMVYLVKEVVSNRDGIELYRLGISSLEPSNDMIIRVGSRINDSRIGLEKSYDTFGVCSAEWEGDKYAVVRYEDDFVRSVEKVRDGLERLLK